MRSDVSKINENTPYEELTEGLMMFAKGTARDFATGPWRTMTPVFDKELCKQCLLCAPVCPDGCIPVSDMKRSDFDYDHCKGCGICEKACPFNAITMVPGTEPVVPEKGSTAE
ncbi:MAG: 4Fe-4S binding protein [Lachnospiraceae bacterium]|nr:4Fe-4S binding protein [Lachnospiraceae bacterium]